VVGPPLSQFYRYTSLYILLVTPKEISTELSPSHQSSVGLVPRKAWIWKLWVNFHKHGVKSLFYLLDYIFITYSYIYIIIYHYRCVSYLYPYISRYILIDL
jgi:hypothetical protein